MDKKDRRLAKKQKKAISELFLLSGKLADGSEPTLPTSSSKSVVEEKVKNTTMDSKKVTECVATSEVVRQQLNYVRNAKVGPKLMLTMQKLNGVYLSHPEFRDLIQYSLIGPSATKPRWCNFRPWKSVSQTLVIRAECPPEYIENNDNSYPFIDEFFERSWIKTDQEISNRDEFWRHVLNVPVSLHDQIKEKVLMMDYVDAEEKKRILKAELMLTAADMASNGYPFPNGTAVPTREMYAHVTADSPMYALDCEMCITTAKVHELTRISLIREDGSVVLDTLVKPENAITDYLTKFSGITLKMMEDVTVTLEDVQIALQHVLPADAILIGHSLEFDLRALNMSHPYVVDIGLIYNISGTIRKRTSLKNLVSLFLEESIQDGRGHCSVEDSWAAMKLVKMKLAKGLIFGNCMFGWSYDAWIKEWKEEKAKQLSQKQHLSEGEPDRKRVRRENGTMNLQFCGCGQRIGIDCIVKDCQCQISPPSKCVLCLRMEPVSNELQTTFNWSDAVRVDKCTKVRPLSYYLCDSQKTVMCGFKKVEDYEVPKRKYFTVRDPESFPNQPDFIEEVCMDMLDYGLVLVDLTFSAPDGKEDGECGADAETTKLIDGQIERLVRNAAKYSLIIVILSSPKSNICYLKVKA